MGTTVGFGMADTGTMIAGAGLRHARPGEVSLPRGSDTVKSVSLTGSVDAKLTVDIYGSKDGAVLYHSTVKLTHAEPTRVHLDYAGIDTLEFVSSRHGDHLPQERKAGHLAFDDFVFGGIAAAVGGDHARFASAFGPDRLASGSEGVDAAGSHADLPHVGLHPLA